MSANTRYGLEQTIVFFQWCCISTVAVALSMYEIQADSACMRPPVLCVCNMLCSGNGCHKAQGTNRSAAVSTLLSVVVDLLTIGRGTDCCTCSCMVISRDLIIMRV